MGKKAHYKTLRLDIPGPFQAGRGHANQLMAQSMNRMRMALAEVRLVQRHEGGPELVANRPALQRLLQAWTQTAQAIGMARRAAGLCEGPQRPNTASIELASNKLEEYRKIVSRLEVLGVWDESDEAEAG